MKLSREQRKKLQEAFLDAFYNKSLLEQMLSFGLNKNLDAIAGGSNLQEIVFNLIREAEAQNWIEDLIRTARDFSPRNPELKVIAEELLAITPTGQSTQQLKILILAAIPHGLRLDKDISSIEKCIRGAARRDIFKIEIRTAVQPQDFRRSIEEVKPVIVHFCGHGLADGSLVLEDDGGNDKAVSPSALASLFQLHAKYVHCVVLNACHSAKAADAPNISIMPLG